jgi:t-SNARE complex subunit (syntaxin)
VSQSLGFTDKAVDSARAARKKRWICFILLVIILIIIAVIVTVVVLQQQKYVQLWIFQPFCSALISFSPRSK